MSVPLFGKAALDGFAAEQVHGTGEDEGPKTATLCLTAAVEDLPCFLS